MVDKSRRAKYDLKVRAVIFDMDGVITHTMPDHYRAWRKVFQAEGVEVTPLDIYSREGQRGIMSVREILLSKNYPYTEAKGIELLQQKEELFKEIVKERFIPGTRGFLKHLAQGGMRLALVTGTARHELLQILPATLRKLFAIIITADDVKIGKPDPEPYQRALQMLEVGSDDAVVIENAPFGIESAKAAGIRCFAVETSLPRQYLEKADRVFSSIKELRAQVNFLVKDNPRARGGA